MWPVSKIRIELEFADWCKILDALKYAEFNNAFFSEMNEEDDFDSFFTVRKCFSFFRLSKEIRDQMYSVVFRDGCDYGCKCKELELERKEQET